jgi:MFS family permease
MLTTACLNRGIGIGMLSMVALLCISEISPPEIRGTLLILEEFSIATGIVIAFWNMYGTRFMHGEWAWRLLFCKWSLLLLLVMEYTFCISLLVGL